MGHGCQKATLLVLRAPSAAAPEWGNGFLQDLQGEYGALGASSESQGLEARILFDCAGHTV